ncbi:MULTISPECIES: hypothetical protein [Capnocytophaga]|uniref:hypothetical protein n=1 Tax=Capnocytophaga sp. oral taxon 332 TaxID=712213 RepID=UPI0002A30EAB|nr:hypothetical protein [Capnocytophaga sp. oral taxon 332]EKY10660.1 hypothetical protein HMPREF9075_01006 [Capnocytophaga sp. oral taxon 332 str. F0381]
MAEILDIFGGENLQKIVNGLSEKTGISTDKVNTVLDSLKQMLGKEGNAAELLSKLKGGEQSTLQAISEKTGISLDNVSQIFQHLPSMFSNFFGGKDGGSIGDKLTSLLDKNKDGNVMDDIVSGIGNLFKGK